MSLKNSIAIGKCRGNLVKIDTTNGVDSTFRSYLRLLVEIDVSKPLHPGFLFTRMDNSTTWISMKYERLYMYCTDCSLIGHKKIFCLTPRANKFPSKYTISLHVNIFSNLNSSPAKPLNQANLFIPSSTPRITPSQSCMTSSSPHANLQKAHNNLYLPLTPSNPSLLAHTTKSSDTLIRENPTQSILSQTPLTAAEKDTPIEYTLNALSLFPKPIKLFPENQLSSTRKLTSNSPS
jgi:hypothetical protein